ncbi:unnamed protein product [Caenorhabditis angaria]|uniref:Piwi domain-containing protein n=1 Tax=Caenorhabditis angaria TaxID=860376 RepID=A0A9P1I7N8_9PELO|nr:unnamed protein product [Caenorhabditis angaria]
MQNTFSGGSSRGRGNGPYQGNRGGIGGGGMRGGRGRGGPRYFNGPQRSSSPVNREYDLFEDKDTPSPPPSYSDRNRRDGNRNQVNSYRGRNDDRNGYSIRGNNTNNHQRSFSPTGSYSRPQQSMVCRQPSPQGRRSPPPSRYPPQRSENLVNNRRGRSPSPPRVNNYSNERAPQQQQQQQSSSRNQNDQVAERLMRRIEENEQDVRALEEQLSRARRRLEESYHELQQHRRSTEQPVMSCQTIEINSIQCIEEKNPNYIHNEDLNREDQEEEEDMQNLTNQLKKTTFAPIQSTYSSDKLTEVAEKLKPAVITAKNRVSILTNYWDINVQSKTVYRYDVDVNVVFNTNDTEKTVSLTEGSKTASSRVEHHQLCLAALRAGLEAYSAFRQQAATVYDCVTQLYTSEELEMEGSGSITIEVSPQQLHSMVQHRFSEMSNIRITISPNQSLPSFDPSDYSKENQRDLSENNKIVSNFLNMLTNESAQRNGLTVFGSGRLFDMEKQGEKIGSGQEKRMGIDKGIKFIEGGVSPPKNNNNKKSSNDKNTLPALLLDAKCGIFFSRQSLLTTLTEKFGNLNLDWREIDAQAKSPSHRIRNAKWVEIQQYSKGLRFERTYSTKRTFTISGISEQPIKDITFSGVDGQKVRVLDYLKDIIGNEVGGYNGNLPAVEVRKYDPVNHKTSNMYFAMESIVITENQRVPISKQTEPPRPIKPQDRWGRINQLIGELNLEQGGKRNEIMRMFGVSLSETPKKVIGVKRDAPKVIFANEKHVDIGPQRHDWKSFDCRAILPAKTKAVIVSYPKRDERIAIQAKDALVRKCQQNGLQIDKWHMIDIERFVGTPHKKIIDLFDYVAREQSFGPNPLILFLDWEKSKSHDSLKLAERRSKVVSQQITMEKARMLIKQSMTCANVVKKMNIKLGGLNYRVDPESFAQSKWLGKEPILIISYDVAHPGRVNKNEAVVVPSVVGFAFNGGFHPEAFVGDYHFQYPKMEQVDSNILTARIKWMLQSFIEYRKCWPTKILVIRDGVSEGQYEMVLRDELEALKEGCREFGNLNKKPDWCPPFGLVIATKRHSTRLFKEKNGGVENCQPGTVVDRDIVRPVIGDAFIVSAHAIQGTARPVCYSILKNEIGLKDMDEFESIMLGLTFHHQITDSPISLPEPVYQADEWAKRGNNMWKAFDINYDIPKVKGEVGKPNHADFEKMTENLAIWRTSLSGKRVNA